MIAVLKIQPRCGCIPKRPLTTMKSVRRFCARYPYVEQKSSANPPNRPFGPTASTVHTDFAEDRRRVARKSALRSPSLQVNISPLSYCFRLSFGTELWGFQSPCPAFLSPRSARELTALYPLAATNTHTFSGTA